MTDSHVMAVSATDKELLARFVRGQREALGELAQRYERALLGLSLGILGGQRDLAMDVVQETWVRVIRFGDRFDGRSSVKTWLYRIAINQSHTMLAKVNPATSSSPSTLDDLQQSEIAMTNAQTSERKNELSRAVQRLPLPKRTVLLLCYHAEATHEQAAEVLGIPLGTLKSRLNAALKDLRSALSPEVPA
jgi:RNA polymerase sigma-70 factor, ECF subfamily